MSLISNPLKQVSNLLGQFTTLQTKLSAAVEAIRARRAAHLQSIEELKNSIIAVDEKIAECDLVAKQAENAITGIDKLLSGE